MVLWAMLLTGLDHICVIDNSMLIIMVHNLAGTYTHWGPPGINTGTTAIFDLYK